MTYYRHIAALALLVTTVAAQGGCPSTDITLEDWIANAGGTHGACLNDDHCPNAGECCVNYHVGYCGVPSYCNEYLTCRGPGDGTAFSVSSLTTGSNGNTPGSNEEFQALLARADGGGAFYDGCPPPTETWDDYLAKGGPCQTNIGCAVDNVGSCCIAYSYPYCGVPSDCNPYLQCFSPTEEATAVAEAIEEYTGIAPEDQSEAFAAALKRLLINAVDGTDPNMPDVGGDNVTETDPDTGGDNVTDAETEILSEAPEVLPEECPVCTTDDGKCIDVGGSWLLLSDGCTKCTCDSPAGDVSCVGCPLPPEESDNMTDTGMPDMGGDNTTDADAGMGGDNMTDTDNNMTGTDIGMGDDNMTDTGTPGMGGDNMTETAPTAMAPSEDARAPVMAPTADAAAPVAAPTEAEAAPVMAPTADDAPVAAPVAAPIVAPTEAAPTEAAPTEAAPVMAPTAGEPAPNSGASGQMTATTFAVVAVFAISLLL